MVKLSLRCFLWAVILLTVSAPVWSVGFTISGATVTLSGSTLVSTSGNVLLSNGSLIANSAQFQVGGDWTQAGASFNAGTSTVTFMATAVGHHITSQGIPFGNIVFNGSGGYWTLQDSMTVLSNWTLTVGTLDTHAGNNFGISVGGDWNNNGGTFVPNLSTVTISGASASTTTFRGATSFSSLQCLTPGKTLVLPAGIVQTIANALTLTGASGNLVRVRSSIPGSFAYVTNIGTNTVTYVDAQDSNAGGGTEILAGVTSLNSGNNINWNFGHIAPSNIRFQSIFVSSLTLAWDSVTSEQGYSLEVSTASDFSGTRITSMTVDGSLTALTLPPSLQSNTAYFARVGARWTDGTTNYAASVPASQFTLANAVTGTQLVNLFTSTATVTWSPLPTSPPSASAQGYRLEASATSDFSGPVISSSTTQIAVSTLTVTGLTPGTAYFFHVGSLNGNNVPDFAAAVSGTTASGSAPRSAVAIWGVWDPVADLFTLSWHAVTTDINGLATTIDHYLIQRSDSINSIPSFTTTVSSTTLSYSQATGGQIFFFQVEAVGTNGFASTPSDYVDSSAEAELYILADDNAATRLLIPNDLDQELRKENNTYGDDIVLQLLHRPQDETSGTVNSHNLIASKASTGEQIPAFAFSASEASLQMTSGSGSQPVGLYWSNGQSFVPFGSPAAAGGTLSATIRNSGIFQVRQVTVQNHFRLVEGSPYPRVITPNASNNHRVFFLFDNPGGGTISGAIYDMTGAKVADLNVNSQSPSANALFWDGKSSDGTVVHGGVYLYKVTAGTGKITGTVVVAR